MATISKQKDALIKRLTNNVDTALKFVKDEAEDRTPEDKKNLVKNFEIEPAREVWDKIVWKVKNNTPYAFFVEFWTRRAKNYHKPKWTIFFQSRDYKGLPWARMLTRAVDENRSQINKLLTK